MRPIKAIGRGVFSLRWHCVRGPGDGPTAIFCTSAFTHRNSQVIGKSLTDITNEVGTVAVQANKILSDRRFYSDTC